MSSLTGFQIYTDTFSREPSVKWPALHAIAAHRAATETERKRRYYYKGKAKRLAALCREKGFALYV